MKVYKKIIDTINKLQFIPDHELFVFDISDTETGDKEIYYCFGIDYRRFEETEDGLLRLFNYTHGKDQVYVQLVRKDMTCDNIFVIAEGITDEKMITKSIMSHLAERVKAHHRIIDDYRLLANAVTEPETLINIAQYMIV